MLKDRIRQVLTVIFAITQMSIGAPPFAEFVGGFVGDMSDQYMTRFTPAGYTFAVWSVIYVALLAYAIYQALPSQTTNPVLRLVGVPVLLAMFLNTVWVPVFVNEFIVLSAVIIGVTLASLIFALVRLREYRRENPLSTREYWLVRFPVSITAAWLTVATAANIALTLVAVGWDGFGIRPDLWAMGLLVVATLIVLGVLLYTRGNIAYGAIILWALVGIAVGQSGGVTITAYAMFGVVTAALVVLNVPGLLGDTPPAARSQRAAA